MKYTVIMTPTAKSDIVNLKSSLEQQIIDSSFIRKLSYKKYLILYKVINNNIYIFYIRPSKMNILQEIQNI